MHKLLTILLILLPVNGWGGTTNRNYLTQPITVTIPGDYPNIQEAWNAIAPVTDAGGQTITFNLTASAGPLNDGGLVIPGSTNIIVNGGIITSLYLHATQNWTFNNVDFNSPSNDIARIGYASVTFNNATWEQTTGSHIVYFNNAYVVENGATIINGGGAAHLHGQPNGNALVTATYSFAPNVTFTGDCFYGAAGPGLTDFTHATWLLNGQPWTPNQPAPFNCNGKTSVVHRSAAVYTSPSGLPNGISNIGGNFNDQLGSYTMLTVEDSSGFQHVYIQVDDAGNLRITTPGTSLTCLQNSSTWTCAPPIEEPTP